MPAMKRSPKLKLVEDLSAGGVVYRQGPEGLEFVVGEQIDWRTGDRNVRLPKGHLDAGETAIEAARREVAEETGRTVRVIGPLAEHRYQYDVPARKKKKNGAVRPAHRVDKRVVFFLMEDMGDHAEGPDGEMQAILWLDEEEACKQLSFENERDMIRLAARRIMGDGNRNPA